MCWLPELFYRDIGKIGALSAEDPDFTMTKTKDIALPSFHTYDNVPHHLKNGGIDTLNI